MMYYVLSIISILFVGCTTAYRGDRVEKVRVGIPALFAVEVDYLSAVVTADNATFFGANF